jgi:hypothetical protein
MRPIIIPLSYSNYRKCTTNILALLGQTAINRTHANEHLKHN